MERSKSRAMADLLATKELGLSSPKEQALYAQLMQQRTKIASLQTQLFALTTGTPNAQTKEKIAEKSASIQALEKEYARLMTRMYQEAPRLQELVLAQPAALERLQQAMRAEHFEVVQYLVIDTGLILWHIGPDSVTVRNVFIPRQELVTKVIALQNSLSDRYRAFDATFDQETARELFLFLIQPVLGSIRGNRLVIIPHEELHRLPFQSLINPADGRFLGERFQLSYAPSATVLLSLKRTGNVKGGRLLAIADPELPATQEEVRAIGQFYPNRSKVVQNALAPESDVKTWIGNYDVIHPKTWSSASSAIKARPPRS